MPEGDSDKKDGASKNGSPSSDTDGTLDEATLEKLAAKAAEQAEAKFQARLEELERHNRSLQSKADKEVAKVRLEERAQAQQAREQDRAELIQTLRQSVDDPDAEQALQKLDLTYQQRNLEEQQKTQEELAEQQADYEQQLEFIAKTLDGLGLTEQDVNPDGRPWADVYGTPEDFVAAASKISVEKKQKMSADDVQAMIDAKTEEIKKEAEEAVRKKYGMDKTAAPEPTTEPSTPQDELRKIQKLYGQGQITAEEYVRRKSAL